MVLHGWKQIAQYLGCGIRTAQRWESECELPVTRPRNHLRSPVLAHSEVLDSWAGRGSVAAAELSEARLVRMEREIEALKRQIMLIGAERERGQAADAERQRQRQIAAKAPSFDA